jgi:hypothetical protein
MTPKVAAAIRHLHARDKALGRVARSLDIQVRSPVFPWHRNGRSVATVPARGLTFVMLSWERGEIERLAYSLGWAAYTVKHRPDRGLRKVGAFANRDAKKVAELANNVAIRRRLDKVFGYKNGIRPFEPRPFEEDLQSRVASMGTECCDDSACVFVAMTTPTQNAKIEQPNGILGRIFETLRKAA